MSTPGRDDPERFVPTEIRAPMGARVMEIEWADGESTRAAHLMLRAFCPCAHCQGHQGPVRWAAAADEADEAGLGIEEIAPVGNYAIRLRWGDGHETGIYSFRFLRELSELGEEEPAVLREHIFGR